jgi:hypothetical protein
MYSTLLLHIGITITEFSFVGLPRFSGFVGLVVSMLASGTQDRGFEPGRSRRIFRAGEKIHSMPSFGGEIKPSAPCRRFAACKTTPAIYVEVGIASKIDRAFLTQFRPSLTEVSHFA